MILVLGAVAVSTAADQLDLGKINVTHLIKDYHPYDSLLLCKQIIDFFDKSVTRLQLDLFDILSFVCML